MLKRIFDISLKHAVNALLTNTAFMGLFPATFHLHDKVGLLNIGKSALTIIVAREAMVWLPRVLKWTTTNTELPGEPKP